MLIIRFSKRVTNTPNKYFKEHLCSIEAYMDSEVLIMWISLGIYGAFVSFIDCGPPTTQANLLLIVTLQIRQSLL